MLCKHFSLTDVVMHDSRWSEALSTADHSTGAAEQDLSGVVRGVCMILVDL